MEAELQRVQGIEARWKEAEQRAQEADRRAREAERRAQEAEQQVQERFEPLHQVHSPLLAQPLEFQAHVASESEEDMGGRPEVLQRSFDPVHNTVQGDSPAISANMPGSFKETMVAMSEPSYTRYQSVGSISSTIQRESPGTASYMRSDPGEEAVPMSGPPHSTDDERVNVNMQDATYSPRTHRARFGPRTWPDEENTVISPISV